MSDNLYLRALAVWCGLFVLAVVNGAVRDLVVAPSFGAAALPLSGLTAIIAFTIAIALFVRWMRPSVKAAWAIGLLWLVLTLVAETLLTLLAGRPAGDVVRALGPGAVARGDLLVILVLVTTIAPAGLAHLMRRN